MRLIRTYKDVNRLMLSDRTDRLILYIGSVRKSLRSWMIRLAAILQSLDFRMIQIRVILRDSDYWIIRFGIPNRISESDSFVFNGPDRKSSDNGDFASTRFLDDSGQDIRKRCLRIHCIIDMYTLTGRPVLWTLGGLLRTLDTLARFHPTRRNQTFDLYPENGR